MTRKWDRVVAWPELLGGTVGLVVLLPLATIQMRGVLTPTYYVGAGLGFLLAAIAGWRLLRGKQFGRELSLAVQILQVVQVTATGWMFKYVTGLQVLVRIGRSLVEFSPGVNAGVWLGPTLVPVAPSIGINLFALWATIYLARQSGVNRLRVAIEDPDLTASSTASTA
jgi:hypothetical protein